MTAPYTALSSSLDWLTPLSVIERVRRAFGGTISLDPCSNEASRVKATVEYKLPISDGLKDSWDFPTVFVNPPYGRCHVHRVTKEYLGAAQFAGLSKSERKLYTSTTIAAWVDRCARAYEDHRSQVIALIPAAVETKQWQVVFRTATAACFPKRRIRFDLPADQMIVGRAAKNCPPMGCALVYWGRELDRFRAAFEEMGFVNEFIRPLKLLQQVA